MVDEVMFEQQTQRRGRESISSVALCRAALLQSASDNVHPPSLEDSSTVPRNPFPNASEGDLPDFPSSFPSFKRIPGTRFIVDGFLHAGPWSMAYFLSHFHSDHYTGLTQTWNKGVIFCSPITARLITECIKVCSAFVCPLPIGERVTIDSCQVTLVEANHCPGAVQMLFDVYTHVENDSMRYVHTGDMRYSPHMTTDSCLCDFVGADAVFLDTTYCNPKFIFPTQNESIDYISETVCTLMKEADKKIEVIPSGGSEPVVVQMPCSEVGGLEERLDSTYDAGSQTSHMIENEKPSEDHRCCKDILEDAGCVGPEESYTCDSILDLLHGFSGKILFLISTYIVGKEKILLAVANRCNCKIYVDEKKYSILKCLDLENLDVFSTDPTSTNVHVVPWNFLGNTWPFFRPNFRNMEDISKKLSCSRVVGFVPTGWTYETRKKDFSVRRKGQLEIHLVPYSEHSSYDELRKYVGFLRPKEIIPTVGLDGRGMDGKAVATMRKYFRNLVDETENKRRFLKGFCRTIERTSESTQVNSLKIRETHHGLSKADLTGHMCETDVVDNIDPDVQRNSKQITDDSMSHELPRSAFPRKAKQRLSDARGTTSVVVEMAKKQKMVASTNKSLLVCSASCHLGNQVTRRVDDKINEKEKLKSILPLDVSEEQVEKLLLRANRDLNLAVTLYFEGSRNEPEEQKELPISVGALDTTASGGPPFQQPGSRRSLSDFRKVKMSPVIDSPKISVKRLPLASNKKGRTSQSSILSFFKKYPTNALNATDANNWNDEAVVQKPAETTVQGPEGFAKKDLDMQEKIEKMCAILGDSTSVEKVTTLLKEAYGDMGLALDSYYKEGCATTLDTNRDKESNAVIRDAYYKESNAVIRDASKLGTFQCKEMQVIEESPAEMTDNHKKEGGTYSVAKTISEFKPIEHACWRKGEPAPYIHMARTFDLVEMESGRLKTSDMLCNMFRSLLILSPDAVLPAIYLATNRIAPNYENVDLNVGGSIVSAAVAEVTGTNKQKIKEMYNAMGDLGDVAQVCRQTQSLLIAPRSLTIQQVYSTLMQISKETGSGSSSRRKGLIVNLLRACREKEMKYIVRTLVQNMRIGAMIRSVLPAVAQAVVLHNYSSIPKSEQLKTELQVASTAILDAYNMMPNLNILIPTLLEDGITAMMNGITACPGIPMKPMLAKIANGVIELFKHFSGKAFTCEYKYDGQRAQVHLINDGSIKIFSRNCEDTTARFPDVIDIVRKALKANVQDLIFDAEIVAVDKHKNNKVLAFQYLSTRERGRLGSVVSAENIKVDVCVFGFDLMYLNGKPLVKLSLQDRRKRMHECFQDTEDGSFQFAKQITIEAAKSNIEDSDELEKVNAFLNEAVCSSCEGIMVKALKPDSEYVPSKRSDSWLKVKKDYVEGLHDTLDLVPIGAWYGNGRKAGWYSPFLLACYDSDHEEFQSVCRVMSGFTDSFYKEMKEFFSGEHLLPRKPTYYHTLEEPEVWFRPELVWEIRGADLTVSPVHQAAVGLMHPSRGISLRFPRFIRQRPDKTPESASSSVEIADLFFQQNRKVQLVSEKQEKMRRWRKLEYPHGSQEHRYRQII